VIGLQSIHSRNIVVPDEHSSWLTTACSSTETVCEISKNEKILHEGGKNHVHGDCIIIAPYFFSKWVYVNGDCMIIVQYLFPE